MSSLNLGQANEATPSLSEEDESSPRSVPDSTWPTEAVNKAILRLCICDAVLVFALSLNHAPLTTVFERIICAQYYGISDDAAGGLSDLLCKAEPIQHELAVLRGWKVTVAQIPGVFLALPFGLAIDRIGRRPFFILFLVGLLCSDIWTKLVCLLHDYVPLRLIWVGPLWETMGGGVSVGSSLMLTMVADIIPEDKRVGAFMKLATTELGAQTLATSLAALTMQTSILIPLGLSSLLWLVAVALSCSMPETHPIKRSNEGPLPKHGKHVESDEPCQESLSERIDRLRNSCHVIVQNPLVVIMLFISLFTIYIYQVWELLLQYASKYYDWSFGLASLLTVIRGLTSLVLTVFLLPWANRFIARHYKMTTVSRDLKIAQISGLLSFIGFLLMAFAFRPQILVLGVITGALGSGVLDAINSIMTALVPPTSIGLLYTAIAVFRSIGGFISGPLVAELFGLGMRMGGLWIGLPYALGAMFFALILVTLFVISNSAALSASIKEKQRENQSDDETSSLLADGSLILPIHPHVPG